MKKFFSAALVLVCLFSTLPVHARDASPSAYGHASDESVFIRVSDWFATVGKPEDEKDMVVAQRRTERMAKEAQKAMTKQAKVAGKKMKAFGKDLEDAFK